MWLIVLMLGLLGGGGSSWVNDYPALKTNLVYEVGGENQTRMLQINYSQLHQWREICSELSSEIGTNSDVLVNGVLTMLTDLQYPEYILDPELQQTTAPRITSHTAVRRLMDASLSWQSSNHHVEKNSYSDLFLLDNQQRQSYLANNNTLPSRWIDRLLHPEQAHTTWLPPYLQRPSQFVHNKHSPAQVILYQTIGANTGGTTAMYLLHRTLYDLGYNVLICNGTNRYSAECTAPSDNSLIITGEWCHEVFAEYVLNPSAEQPHVTVETLDKSSEPLSGFNGRGVQYYLGYHHAQDSCRGSAAVTDCHYLSKSLGSKGLSAYYLGCAMADHIKNAFKASVSALDDITDPTATASEHSEVQEWAVDPDGSTTTSTQHGTVQIIKEDLILVDPDFFTDYPPYPHPLDLQLPTGYKYLYAKGYTPEQMVLLLQRAKIVLDLGMPGPERLSTECIVMGCIPIVSNRWTGASQVDYPGVHRVDHQNSTQVALTIAHVAENYESELSSVQNGRFFTYALSMWNKVHQTADIVVGSSYLHFVLYARDLQAEYGRTFHILALLYLYPLCSMDLYVTDVLWFMRHHYAFFELLQQAGYVRADPLDPREFTLWSQDPAQSRSFVRIKLLSTLDTFVQEHLSALTTRNVAGDGVPTGNSAVTVAESLLAPAWPAVVIVLAGNAIFRHPIDLLVHVTDTPVTDFKVLMRTQQDGSEVIGALVLAPQGLVNNATLLLHSMISTHSERDASSPLNAAFVDMKSVCALYEQTRSVECMSAPDIICGVVNTAAWQSNLIFAESLGYECN